MVCAIPNFMSNGGFGVGVLSVHFATFSISSSFRLVSAQNTVSMIVGLHISIVFMK